MTIIIGVLGGFVSGFFGAGGGLIIMPALISFLKVDDYKARGTTLATTFVAILITAIFYMNYNYFDLDLAIKISIGGIIGGFIGAKILNKIPKKILTIVFDIFLIFVSIKMIF